MKAAAILLLLINASLAEMPITETIAALHQHVAASQATEDKHYTPPMSWATSRGTYRSDIRINWHGAPSLALSRDYLSCYDTNSFSTLWITTALIEAYTYGTATRPNEDQMMAALKAINLFHNRNNPTGDGAMNFWPQLYNKSTGMWISRPENVFEGVEFIQKYTPFRLLESIFKYFNWQGPLEILDFFKRANGYFGAFLIPSDFDDTYLNIGLGSLLKSTRTDFPTLYNIWAKNNTRYRTAFQDLKRYAYRPMSMKLDSNAIDPRTYYYLRGFLQDAKKNSKPVSLITTWVQNITEERYRSSKGVSMPFHINNVDTTVAANSIYGLTSAVLYNLSTTDWFDMDIQTIYSNTTSLIEWLIEHDMIEERPDLALTYYPSRYSFYYYVARTLFILENQYAVDGSLPFKALDETRIKLKKVLQGKVSNMLLSEAIADDNLEVYYEEFLGNGDTDLNGKPLKRGEDRLFSTSMVINFYIATWTTQNKTTGKLCWTEDVSNDVKETIGKAVRWLNRFILEGTYKPFSVFFSGSVKGEQSMPMFFPANHFELLNGTILPSNTTRYQRNMFIAMSGVMDEDEYDNQLRKPHFGRMTPTNFTGYNDQHEMFPFWTSNAYTYANSLLALAKFNNIE